MTCIVGLVHEDRVWMGGDSAITLDTRFSDIINAGKLWRSGDLLFGSSGTLRAAQLVRYETTFKKRPPTCTAFEYMIKSVIPEIRKCIQSKDVANNKEYNGNILIGYQGQLFEMSGDYSLVHSTANYAAVGGGGELALGVMFATQGLPGLPPDQRIRLALQAAERFNSGCSAPFFVECL